MQQIVASHFNLMVWRRHRPVLPVATMLMATIILAGFVTALLSLAGASVTLQRELRLLATVAVIVTCGQIIVMWAIPGRCPGKILLSVIVGYAITTLALLLGVFFIGFGVQLSMIVWGALVATAAALAQIKRRSVMVDIDHAQDGVVLTVAAGVILFVCRSEALAPSKLRLTGIMPAWVDYFVHGAEIAQFVGNHGPVHGDILLAGAPLPLYHYGIYLFPAFVSGVFDLSGLATACAVLLPFGLLLALIGAYALTAGLSGRWAGIFVFGCLLLVPDASRYGFRDVFFGFDWLIFTAPGSGYALGIGAAAFVLAERSRQDRRVLGGIAGTLLALCLFQIRAQIFVLFLPTFAATFLVQKILGRCRARHVLEFFALAAAVAVWIAVSPPWFGHTLIRTGDTRTFLNWSFAQQTGIPPYTALYLETRGWPEPLGLFVGTALLVPLILGAFALVFPLVLVTDRRTPQLQTADLFMALLLGAYVALVLVAPRGPQGDITEYRERPFVLVYFWIVCLTAAHFANLVVGRVAAIWPSTSGSRATSIATVALGLASVTLIEVTRFDPAVLNEAWAKQYYGIAVDPGVFAVANYLNAHSGPRDIVAFGPVNPNAQLFDTGTVIASLTGLPIYLTTPGTQSDIGGNRARLTERRLKIQTAINGAATWSDAAAMMRTASITWYVDIGSQQSHTAWRSAVPSFENAFGSVYHVPLVTR